jgi:A/G-specific adenine glycosylase
MKQRTKQSPASDQLSGALPSFRRRLLKWYEANRRDLPWRRTRDPYRIWLSEVMLQQTRVSAVIPYYERFLKKFPAVADLANASEQELLAVWSGLGYYSRARNLHRAAKTVHDAGSFTRDYDAIRQLPGIGDYTAAAVASIAFGLSHAVLDGNVLRVLSRIAAERSDLRSSLARGRLGALAGSLIHTSQPGEFNQALMELGATVCLPKQPQCSACPVEEHCAAHRLGIERELPILSKRAQPLRCEKQLLVIESSGSILFWQRPGDSKRLAGFWELPEKEQLPDASLDEIVGRFRHTIVNTNYHIHVHRARLSNTPDGFYWVDTKCLQDMPLSTTARKALACLEGQAAKAARA